MPFWASGDWHDDYYYYISLYDMSLLYIIYYYYYYYYDDDDDDDDGTREAELILTQVISNNLDSNMETMETMGWQIVLMSRYL